MIPTKIKKLLDSLGYSLSWSQEQKKKFKPLIDFVISQHEQIKKLEAEIRDIRQPDIFVDKYNGQSTTLAIDESKREYSLNAHCASLLNTFGIGHDAITGFCNRKGLKEDEFLKLAAEGI